MQTYVKHKLGETPEPHSTESKSKVAEPSTPTVPVPKDVLAVSQVKSAVEGERWDPNKSLDRLKSGVVNRLREQQQRRSLPATRTKPGQEEEDATPPKITIDDGTH
jgi:hypothetical protein